MFSGKIYCQTDSAEPTACRESAHLVPSTVYLSICRALHATQPPRPTPEHTSRPLLKQLLTLLRGSQFTGEQGNYPSSLVSQMFSFVNCIFRVGSLDGTWLPRALIQTLRIFKSLKVICFLIVLVARLHPANSIIVIPQAN